jgi:hypothetical protein
LNNEGDFHNWQLSFLLQIIKPRRIACPEAKADVVIEAEGGVIFKFSLSLNTRRDADVIMEEVLPDVNDVVTRLARPVAIPAEEKVLTLNVRRGFMLGL